MDSISLIKSPISAELEDFKKHFDSCLSSSNLLLNSVIAQPVLPAVPESRSFDADAPDSGFACGEVVQ